MGKRIENLIWRYLAKHPDFEMEILDALTDDCPYFEQCIQSAGESHYDGMMDAYD